MMAWQPGACNYRNESSVGGFICKQGSPSVLAFFGIFPLNRPVEVYSSRQIASGNPSAPLNLELPSVTGNLWIGVKHLSQLI